MIYRERRVELIRRVREQYPHASGNIVIAASYEDGRNVLWQDSTFWYFTGLSEPGAVVVLSTDGVQTLYVPAYDADRSIWMDCDDLNACGFDEIKPLGDSVRGYHPTMWFTAESHAQVIAAVTQDTIFACFPAHVNWHYTAQRWMLERWSAFLPVILQRVQDISAIVADMRRTKSCEEVELMRRAVQITLAAQARVQQVLHDDILESELHALIMSIFLQHDARAAFSPIVAGGSRATILHYHGNNQEIRAGELVVVDIGASVQGYAADVTRTFAIHNQFSDRQRFLYDLVYEAQQAVFQQARPGMWLCNAVEPDRSLHHYAVNIFKRHGLERFFVHSIGHFLGIDVHDVGNAQEPLRIGDVITIEPGLYLREEGIGIRLEDDYLITENGAVCLSDDVSSAQVAV
jgi:Xaa-Pro aminopeptidase